MKVARSEKRNMYMLIYSDHKLQYFVSAVFLSFCFAGSVLAQIGSIPDSQSQTGLGGANAIVGTVFGPSGRPVENRVRIRIASMTSGDRISNTNEQGNFAFRGLPTGSYTISIEKEKEFEPYSTSVDVMQFRGSPPQTYTLNIRLVAKASADAKPGVINSEFAGVPKEALESFEKAASLAKAGDRKGAVEQLKLAIAAHPAFALAHGELGIQYMRIGEFEKADEALRAALALKPDAYRPLLNRGMLLVELKRYAEAEPVLRKVVKADEKAPAGHYFLGQALANQGKFDEAAKELTTAVTTGGPEMKEAHRVLAIIYNVQGDKPRAAVELETYLRLNPKTPDAQQLQQLIEQFKAAPAPQSSTKTKPSP